MKSWLKTGCCLCSFGLFVSQRGCNSLLPDYHQSCKQCICSHKYSKQLSGVTAESPFFACWWLPPPNPFSQNFILRLRTVPALFLPPPAEIFCKRRSWLTSIIANCPAKGSGIFSKNLSGSQSRSQRETLFKGFGMLPNKQNLRFPASPGTAGFERLYIQTPCLPTLSAPYK